MYNDIILQLLTIIEYKDDKEAFVADFTRLINNQALVDLVSALPDAERVKAEEKLSHVDSQESFVSAVHTYFNDTQIQTALDNAAANAITQWISSIAPTLNDDQKQKLVKLASDLQAKMDESKK
jgi:hypothetical protein